MSEKSGKKFQRSVRGRQQQAGKQKCPRCHRFFGDLTAHYEAKHKANDRKRMEK